MIEDSHYLYMSSPYTMGPELRKLLLCKLVLLILFSRHLWSPYHIENHDSLHIRRNVSKEDSTVGRELASSLSAGCNF